MNEEGTQSDVAWWGHLGGRLTKVGEMSKEERDRAGAQALVRVMLELGVSGSIVRSKNEVRAAFHFTLPARSGVRHRAP